MIQQNSQTIIKDNTEPPRVGAATPIPVPIPTLAIKMMVEEFIGGGGQPFCCSKKVSGEESGMIYI